MLLSSVLISCSTEKGIDLPIILLSVGFISVLFSTPDTSSTTIIKCFPCSGFYPVLLFFLETVCKHQIRHGVSIEK